MIDLKDLRRRAEKKPDANGVHGPSCALPREVLELLDLLEAAQKASAWQPIETAPEDEEFLGYKVGIGVIVVLSLDERHPDHDGCTFYNAWDHSPIRDLSHWMPLPPAPASL